MLRDLDLTIGDDIEIKREAGKICVAVMRGGETIASILHLSGLTLFLAAMGRDEQMALDARDPTTVATVFAPDNHAM